MKLKLKRPLSFLDIEATGTNRETDRIIDLHISKMHPDGLIEAVTFRVNPGMPIPPQSTEIHKITDDMVKGLPLFQEKAAAVLEFIAGSDLAGFNIIGFDVPLLYNEFYRAGITWDYSGINMVDAGVIFKRKEARTLTAAMKFYCDRDHSGAHNAEADVKATMDVLETQMRYYDLPQTVEELHLFSNYDRQLLDISGKFAYNEQGEVVYNFGTKRGLIVKHNLDYLDWMYYKANFAPDTRRVCEKLLAEVGML